MFLDTNDFLYVSCDSEAFNLKASLQKITSPNKRQSSSMLYIFVAFTTWGKAAICDSMGKKGEGYGVTGGDSVKPSKLYLI